MKPRGAGFVEQHYRALLSPFFLSNTFQAGVQRRLDYTTQHFVFHGQYCHISTFQLKCHLISGPLHLLPPPRLLCPRFNANVSDLPGRSKEVHCVRTLAITGAFGNTCTCSDASRL